MGFRSWLIKPYAQLIEKRVGVWKKQPEAAQQRIFNNLIKKGSTTKFGFDHNLAEINNYIDYKQAVPIREYEELKGYIELIKLGNKDVLWPGKPCYFAKTSGTTSGVKYIPITNDSIGNHFYSAQTALMLYMVETKSYHIMDGKMIFLSGSPQLDYLSGIPTGRLSGIVNHEIPNYLKGNQLPSWDTNCMEDWDTKLTAIVEETTESDMRLISGIPPWVQMYFNKLIEKTGKPIKDIFPNFDVLVHGGVNFEPYKAKMFETIGKQIASIETYPASEGFFAYQDSQHTDGLLLNVNSGIYFEFVPVNEIFNKQPTRLSLAEVEMGVNYVLIISSNAGLWGYNIGDTIKFVSTNPYRIIVTGRIKHYISAFGEHVIGEEVEWAMSEAANEFKIKITEFTVAPQINVQGELPYHEWLVEFDHEPNGLESFANKLDQLLQQRNIYYHDLIEGKVLQPLKVKRLRNNAFVDYMRKEGKLGGQNKVPRLTNDRQLADALAAYIIG